MSKVDKLLQQAKRLVKKINTTDELQKKYNELPIPGLNEWVQVGVVGVDAGMVWIGDPCYILALPHLNPKEKKDSKFPNMYEPRELPESLGESWIEFCDKVHDDGSAYPVGSKEYDAFLKKQIKKGEQRGQTAVQFNYEMGHPGLGVCMGSGYGDGTYPVFVKRNEEGRITETKIVFIDEEEQEDE
jgi:hypothetical protein